MAGIFLYSAFLSDFFFFSYLQSLSECWQAGRNSEEYASSQKKYSLQASVWERTVAR
jgi:hypothetical protein